MASAEPAASSKASKADASQMVATVSNSTDTSTNDNNNSDEKKSGDVATELTQAEKDKRRVSRQQSAPTANVRVSFKNRKNSKKESIGKAKDNTNNNSNDNKTNNQGSLQNSDNESENDEKKTENPLKRWSSLPPNTRYDPCREFDNFAGDWVDSKGQPVIISAWGVIRYPNNPKLRFEAIHMGPNHLSVTFDRDPKKRKFVGKLNHDCDVLIWSNDTRWTRKGSKPKPQEDPSTPPKASSAQSSGASTPTIDETEPKIDPNDKLNRQGSCIVM